MWLSIIGCFYCRSSCRQTTFSALLLVCLLSIINCLHSPSVRLELKVYRLHCPSQLQSEDQRSPLSIACEGSSVLCVMYILLCGCKCAQELLQTPFSHSRPSVSAWDWFQDTRRYHNPWIPKYLGVRIEPRQNLLCIYILSRLCIIFNKYQCFVNSSYTALFNEYWQGKCIFVFSLYMFTPHETTEDLSVESRYDQASTAIKQNLIHTALEFVVIVYLNYHLASSFVYSISKMS